MNADEILIATEAGVESAPEAFSSAWWQSRSTDELRAFIGRGHAAGAAFDAAAMEAERRAREQLKADDLAQRDDRNRKKRLRRMILEVFLVGALIAAVAALLIR